MASIHPIRSIQRVTGSAGTQLYGLPVGSIRPLDVDIGFAAVNIGISFSIYSPLQHVLTATLNFAGGVLGTFRGNLSIVAADPARGISRPVIACDNNAPLIRSCRNL